MCLYQLSILSSDSPYKLSLPRPDHCDRFRRADKEMPQHDVLVIEISALRLGFRRGWVVLVVSIMFFQSGGEGIRGGGRTGEGRSARSSEAKR